MLDLSNIYTTECDTKYKNHLEILKSLDIKNIPNILFYGNAGVGKKNMISFLLSNKNKNKVINTYKINNKSVNFTVYENNQFLEIDLSEIVLYKNLILKKFIKNISSTKSILNNSIKIVIIHNIDLLDQSEQFIFRKIMEDCVMNCRFILTSTTIDNLLDPIKSRCLCLRLEGFTRQEVSEYIDKRHKVHKSTLKKIANTVGDNIKKTMLEILIGDEIKNSGITGYKDSNHYIGGYYSSIIEFIFADKKISKADVKKLEDKLNALNINFGFSFTTILKTFMKKIIEKIDDDEVESKIFEITLEYERRIKNGSKGIIHVQSYIYKMKNLILN